MRVDFPRVAAAILAAVEDGILPPGMATLNAELKAKSARQSAGQDAPDASRHSGRLARSKMVTDKSDDGGVRL